MFKSLFGNKTKSLDKDAPNLPFKVLLRRTRIVVIDDKVSEFPFKPLTNEGYSIVHWSDVETLRTLEDGMFDIIILDINGVGRKLDSDNEGAGILRHLKDFNPSQIVIAYSGESHDPSRIQFFQQADQFVPKPTNAITWKEILDDLIKTKVNVNHYWNEARRILLTEGLTEPQIEKLEKAILAASKRGDTEIDLKSLVLESVGTVGKLANLLTVLGKVMALLAPAGA